MDKSAFLGCLVFAAQVAGAGLVEKIAERHQVLSTDVWYGHERVKFDFDGRVAWVVKPSVEPRADRAWTWTMQWAEAYVERTGVPELLKHGFHHVTIDLFDTRMDARGLVAAAAFQEYLVRELGFAPKANLIGMSWGGFFSTRYAATYPTNVAKIYLDAPLLNFDRFGGDATLTPTEEAALIGPWAVDKPTDGVWSADPRMPVNMAAAIAAAKIPVYLLYGGQDRSVEPALNCERFVASFRAAGGSLQVEARPLYGHHPHGFEHGDIGKILAYFATPLK